MAPRPLNQNITFFNGYNGVFAVASFGGFADQPSIQATASALAGNLSAANIDTDSQLYSIIYDSPFR